MTVYTTHRDNAAPKNFTKAAVALTAGAIVDVLTVVGGPVLIELLAVDITTAVSADTCAMKFISDPTVGASSTDICTTVDIISAAIGDQFIAHEGSLDPMIKYANGAALPEVEQKLFVPEGGIDLSLANSDPSTGIGTIRVRYIPLVPGARITG